MRGASSVSNFIKHLTCSLSSQPPHNNLPLLHRHCHRHCHRLRLPSSLSSPLFRRHCRHSYSTSSSDTSAATSAALDSGIPLYHSVLIRCRKDVADPLSEALMCFGANSVSMDDHEDYEDSDEVSICSIFTGCEDVKSPISLAADSVGIDMPSFELLKYDPYDWIKRTQALYSDWSPSKYTLMANNFVKESSLLLPHGSLIYYLPTKLEPVEAGSLLKAESFDPVEVTKGLWIVPEWKTPPDAQATNIILNPGLAFGTGEHATTKMCLQFLHQTVKGGELFLDYGTGSGILSIAALKLGAALSVGVDIDPQAITAARQNADLNHIAPELLKLHLVPSKDDASFNDQKVVDASYSEEATTLATDETFEDKDAYDIVVANILLKPLLDLAESIVSHAKEGATIGLSGILHEQVPSVVERYSQFLENISIMKMEDWALITGRKKRDSVSS